MQTIGAFAVIFDPESRVLLCHRTDRDAWNLPGGKVEVGESPWDAVVREVLEEVGLFVRVERLLGVYSIPKRKDLVLNFLCALSEGTIRLSAEADDIRWFNREEIPSTTLPRHVERIHDAYANSTVVHLKAQV